MALKSKFTRRRFLAQAGAAAALATGCARTPNRFASFPLGLQTYSLRGSTFAEALAQMRGLGLGHAEFCWLHLNHLRPEFLWEQQRPRLLSAGIKADGYAPHPEQQPHNEDDAGRMLGMARYFGMRVISLAPDPDELDLYEKLAPNYGVSIAIRNSGPRARYGAQWERPEQIAQALSGRHDLLGASIDAGGFLRSGVDPVEAMRVLKGRIRSIYISDFDGAGAEAVAGEGGLDIGEVVAEARGQRYAGPFHLAYGSDPENSIAGIEGGLVNLRGALENPSAESQVDVE